MSQSFKIVALLRESFSDLFLLSDAELRAAGIRRMTVDAHPGFPCRVSLADAEMGEEVLLLSYCHQSADSPYRASGPIFIRRDVAEATPEIGEVPDAIRRRPLSLRAYDANHLMVGADLCDGSEIEAHIERHFADPTVAYIHVHNAKPGCFACKVERA